MTNTSQLMIADNQQPIFLFSAGPRSGSTLLQRLLTASGNVLIWGEAGGALNSLSDLVARYRQMLGDGGKRYKHGFGGNGAKQYQNFLDKGREGVNEWIASMNPPEELFYQACRSLLEQIYSAEANRAGYARWGVKEILSGTETADFLRKLYPEAKFIFLVRHPMDSLISIKKHDWMDRKGDRSALAYYANLWADLAHQFRRCDYGYRLKYEELISDPELINKLSRYLEFEGVPSDFISSSRADWAATKKTGLSFWEKRAALKLVNKEMGHYGYR